MPRSSRSMKTVTSSTRSSFRAPSTRDTYSMVSTAGRSSYYRRKRDRRSRGIPGFTSKSPFPIAKTYKLRYDQDGYISVGTLGVLGTQQSFNLNSLYDPDRTGTGHQPYGFDALSVAYTRYKVWGCWVDLTFYNVQTLNAITCCYQLIDPMNVSEIISGLDPAKVGERQMGHMGTLQNIGKGIYRRRFFVPMATMFGWSRIAYKAEESNTTAGTNGSPGSIVQIAFAVADPNGNSVGGCRYSLKLTYVATLYQRVIMAQS